MPKLRETPEQAADRHYREAIAAGLARERMTQRTLAEKTKLTPQTLSGYRSNPRNMSVKTLRAMWKLNVLTEADVAAIICY